MTVVALTGHRPEKIPFKLRLEQWTQFYLGCSKADVVITGMAAGFDLWAGKVALDMNIPIICAKPWTTHMPRKGDEDLYAELINNAKDVVVVTEVDKYPGAWVYNARNKWMVDQADKGLACWDGSPGGTKNCLEHFYKQNKNTLIINPKTFEISIQYGKNEV